MGRVSRATSLGVSWGARRRLFFANLFDVSFRLLACLIDVFAHCSIANALCRRQGTCYRLRGRSTNSRKPDRRRRAEEEWLSIRTYMPSKVSVAGVERDLRRQKITSVTSYLFPSGRNSAGASLCVRTGYLGEYTVRAARFNVRFRSFSDITPADKRLPFCFATMTTETGCSA